MSFSFPSFFFFSLLKSVNVFLKQILKYPHFLTHERCTLVTVKKLMPSPRLPWSNLKSRAYILQCYQLWNFQEAGNNALTFSQPKILRLSSDIKSFNEIILRWVGNTLIFGGAELDVLDLTSPQFNGQMTIRQRPIKKICRIDGRTYVIYSRSF